MQPTAVKSGQTALTTLTQARDAGTPYPLLLLDACMPEMDGFTVAASLRQDPTLVGATILMLSSADLAGDAARCSELGISRYLTKPIVQADLWEAITTTLCTPAHVDRPGLSVLSLRPPASAHGWRILLAEDNVVNQLLVVRMLEKRGYRVEVVGTGKAALAALAQHAYDLILMDGQMPEIDGFEATTAIRTREHESGGHVPIIAMTAHSMKDDRERCLDAGMDDYVAKPMKAGDLYAAIDRLLPVMLTPDQVTGYQSIDHTSA